MAGNRQYDDSRFIYNDPRLTYDGDDVPLKPSKQPFIKEKTGGSVLKVPKINSQQVPKDTKDRWNTTPSPTQAHAFLGIAGGVFHTFRFNPDQVDWDYSSNIFSQDTLGGRVIQLLSVSLNGITVAGRAGSRGELQRMAKNIKSIMGYHVSSLNSVDFKVPSRNWHFRVYVQAMPGITWDVSSTSYPYQLNLLVEEDLTGIKTKEINSQVLKRLASGIGYDYDGFKGDALTWKRQYDILQSQKSL